MQEPLRFVIAPVGVGIHPLSANSARLKRRKTENRDPERGRSTNWAMACRCKTGGRLAFETDAVHYEGPAGGDNSQKRRSTVLAVEGINFPPATKLCCMCANAGGKQQPKADPILFRLFCCFLSLPLPPASSFTSSGMNSPLSAVPCRRWAGRGRWCSLGR